MRFLSNKEKKQLNEILWEGYNLEKKDSIVEEDNIIYKNDEKYLIILEKDKKKIKKIIPHLRTLVENSFKAVYIDEGAIPFLIKGADMMRPGIHKIDENIEPGQIILIKDLEHGKTLAVGEAKFNSKDMELQKKGVCVKVLHYMGDENF